MEENDLIYRQDAVDVLNDGAELLRRALDDMDVVMDERKKFEWGLGLIEAYIAYFMNLPSVEQEIIACGDCKHWICHDRRCGFWNHGVKPLDWCCHAERRTDEQIW